MNILVIGNGFDLAHGLPTKYIDFLLFAKMIQKVIAEIGIKKIIPKNDKEFKSWTDKIQSLKSNELDSIFSSLISDEISDVEKRKFEGIKDYIINLFVQGNMVIRKELAYCIHNNFWIEFFIQCPMYQKENWIDFESEISKVIRSLDKDMRELDKPYNIEDTVYDLSNDFLKKMFHDRTQKGRVVDFLSDNLSEEISYKEIRNKLLDDLNKLIRALEIYLTDYVEKIDVNVITPDIERNVVTSGKKGVVLSKVLSFNYTNIYERVYWDRHNINSANDYIDYIHGKADINNTIERNNMVLGIDEYLSKKRRNKDIEFIAFKKFYQRVHKGTGCKYKEWVDQIRGNWERTPEESKAEIRKWISEGDIDKSGVHNLYIFGHSLDVTDKDILRDLILNDNVHTTIFYLNKDVMGQQIADLVKVIGQDELISRTGGSTKTIEFRQQQEMVEISDADQND